MEDKEGQAQLHLGEGYLAEQLVQLAKQAIQLLQRSWQWIVVAGFFITLAFVAARRRARSIEGGSDLPGQAERLG